MLITKRRAAYPLALTVRLRRSRLGEEVGPMPIEADLRCWGLTSAAWPQLLAS